MELGFEESQTPYDSGQQKARAWTEQWFGKWGFCPNCGHAKLDKFQNNRPVADFHCVSCREEFELKSQKARFAKKVVDGAYDTMCERLLASNNPNFVLMNYSIADFGVTNLVVIPKHFFVPEIIQARKPLASTTKRTGWRGCVILLDRIPDSGKVYIVRDREPQNKATVQDQWKRTLFLQNETQAAKGWLLDVMKCVESIGRQEFSLDDVYRYENRLSGLYPDNRHVREKIRQQLQVLRDRGYLEFAARGSYRLSS